MYRKRAGLVRNPDALAMYGAALTAIPQQSPQQWAPCPPPFRFPIGRLPALRLGLLALVLVLILDIALRPSATHTPPNSGYCNPCSHGAALGILSAAGCKLGSLRVDLLAWWDTRPRGVGGSNSRCSQG
ncbi:hypothetical protein IMZ48_23895 [Candidatus Bathyarchaeota archaeon]|nr:hypothetical protein [Candidatus Bathyarchaeota archaeon]